MKRSYVRTYTLCFLSLLLCFSCGGENGKDEAKGFQIAVIPKGTSNVYWQTVHSGALSAAKELGVQVLWSGPKVETDKAQQIEIVEDFIVQGLDGIVLAPQDVNALVPVVDRVADANIPLVLMDSGLNSEKYISYVATDNYKGGAEGAKEMGRRLKDGGKVVIVANDPGGESTNAREKGFRETIEKDFPAIEIIDMKYHYNDRGKARAIMDDLLIRHPNMDGVFCSNESSTMGAMFALQSTGAADRIVFIGFDSSPELVVGLREGVLQAIVQQDPFRIGYEGVKAMVRHLQGEKVERWLDTGVYVVTKENMDEPQIARLLNPDFGELDR